MAHTLLKGTQAIREVARKFPASAVQRSAAADAFSAIAWPQPSEEEWRRTPLGAYDFESLSYGGDFQLLPETHLAVPMWLRKPDEFDEDARQVSREELGGIIRVDCKSRKVSVDAQVAKARAFSRDDHLPDAFASMLEREREGADNRFQLWALAAYDLVIALEINGQDERPLVVELMGAGDDEAANILLLVKVAKASRSTVVLRSHLSDGSLCNTMTLCDVDEGASLEITEIHDDAESSLVFHHHHARLAAKASIKHCSACLGLGFAKTRVEVELGGAGAKAELFGAAIAENEEHLDQRTVQKHLAPSCESRAFYKIAAKDKGRAITQGLIDVAENAAKTDAFLTNRNLVVNDGARTDSIPSLRIATNDVRCSHGSTTGQISEDELFYLEARGFSRDEARKLLVLAFLDEVIHSFPLVVQHHLRAQVARRLGN